MNNTDTIAAIATSLNEGSIGIIRISGPSSFEIANKIYRTKDMKCKLLSFLSHTIHYGFIVSDDEVIDEVMVSVMRAPNTFTREDVVEINCHGGVLVVKKVLNEVIKHGARLAAPGEFTKRAFLNGRIDLSEAEAVMDVISASNNASLNNSMKMLNGLLNEKINKMREAIIYEIAYIESALDDPEHISLDGYKEKLSDIISDIICDISVMTDTVNKGKIIKNGISTVIVGRPNVGKSSLLNLLSNEERAIVTQIPGTTRDIIEQSVNIGDVVLNLVDTAGIRETEDIVENIGVEKAKKYAKEAELVLMLVDSSCELTKEDVEIYDYVKNNKLIIILNKTDLSSVITIDDIYKSFDKNVNIINLSAKNGKGKEELCKTINDLFLSGNIKNNDDLMITSLRHANELEIAKESLMHVKESINIDLPEDFYSIDLMNAYEALGRIIGEMVDDDLVDEIFSKFCMGK